VIGAVGAVRLDITLVALDVTLTITLRFALGISLALMVIVTFARLLTIANILSIAVAIIGAARTVAIAAVTTTIVITVATGRQLASRTTGRCAGAATARRAAATFAATITTTLAGTIAHLAASAGIEAPAGGRRSACPLHRVSDTITHDICLSSCFLTYLDLQKVVAANTLVVHLMVSIVSIATALVLNKGKAGRIVSTGDRF
jgi:hypothetical protein